MPSFYIACRVVLLGVLTLLSQCGSSSDDGSANLPKNTVEAVEQQTKAAKDVRALFIELAIAENAAHDALDNQDFDEWNRYWREDYPDWVDRLGIAAEEFERTESNLVTLLSEAEGAQKFVPLPVVVLAAVTISAIYVKEQERLAAMKQPPPQSDTDAAINRRAAYLEKQGLSPSQSRVRATAEIGEIETLVSLKNGIEHARDFVVEQIPNFLTGYLPERIGQLIDLYDLQGKLGQLHTNVVDAIWSSEGCDTNSDQKADFDDDFVANYASCQVAFCNVADEQCEDIPAGDWNVAVFATGLIRDEVATTVIDNGNNAAEVNLGDPLEADDAREDNNNGNEDLSQGTFEVLAYFNFDGSYGNIAKNADIQISGEAGFPTFQWPGTNTIQFWVYTENENIPYGIYALRDENDERIPLPSTITYGNYDIPNSAPLESAMLPSPELEIGVVYQLSIAKETGESSGETAGLTFRRLE